MNLFVAAIVTGIFGFLTMNFEFVIKDILHVEQPVMWAFVGTWIVVLALFTWIVAIQIQLFIRKK